MRRSSEASPPQGVRAAATTTRTAFARIARPSSHSAARSHTSTYAERRLHDEEGLVDEPAVVELAARWRRGTPTRAAIGARGRRTDDGGGARVVTEALAADEQARLTRSAWSANGVLVGGAGGSRLLHVPGRTTRSERTSHDHARKFGVVDRRARTRETEGQRVRAGEHQPGSYPVEPTGDTRRATSFSSRERVAC